MVIATFALDRLDNEGSHGAVPTVDLVRPVPSAYNHHLSGELPGCNQVLNLLQATILLSSVFLRILLERIL